jgi:integrase
MASVKRIPTGYKGVFYVERKGERILSIFYRKPGDRKQYEEKLGTSAQGWTPARANAERARRINGQELTNNERRQAQVEAKLHAESRPTIERLWQLYLESKGDQLKGVVTDKNRFDLHLRKPVGNKTPQELVPLDVERLRRQVAKDHRVATTRNVLELLRRIINYGVRQRHCPALDWVIELPKQDPNSERIEVLTSKQFQNLQQVWEAYPDRQLSHLHQFIGWTGSRPSEALKLLWKDVDFDRSNYTKRDTKSGKTLIQPMNEKVHEVLLQQRELLNNSSSELQQSSYVFPASDGGICRLDSLKKRFSKLRNEAGIPKEFRPNYCLRDTVASMMLSNGATLAEVAHQLGHAPGSPMTKRYAKFIPAAQQSIANKAMVAMSSLLTSDRMNKTNRPPG